MRGSCVRLGWIIYQFAAVVVEIAKAHRRHQQMNWTVFGVFRRLNRNLHFRFNSVGRIIKIEFIIFECAFVCVDVWLYTAQEYFVSWISNLHFSKIDLGMRWMQQKYRGRMYPFQESVWPHVSHDAQSEIPTRWGLKCFLIDKIPIDSISFHL